jgi:hypothetical protein
MSLNPDYDGIVTLRPYPNAAEAEQRDAGMVEFAPPTAVAADQAPTVAAPKLDSPVQAIEPLPLPDGLQLVVAEPLVAPARIRSRPRWVVPVAIGAVGIIASGTLGGFVWSTIGQRDAARNQLASTQATLAGTQHQLAAAQVDAAAHKLTADYVNLYIVDSGRALTDDENMNVCTGYSQCRTAAQQALTDMQSFQSDRAGATMPLALENSDAMLGDALSAEIAAVQELITGMDNNDLAKVTDGWAKLDSAMLGMGKAESALGAGLK